MRVKQTARKSTATTATTSSGRPIRSATDPVLQRQNALLQTKRKSSTPSQGGVRAQQGVGMGKRIAFSQSGGKKIQGVKIKPRHKPGQLALKEIKRLQASSKLQIPRFSLHRLIREITESFQPEGGIRYQGAALTAIHEASEAYLVQFFEDSYLCTLHAKRVTLFVSDMQLCRRLQRHPGYNSKK